MANGFSQNGFGGITEHLVPLAEKKLILRRQLLAGGGGGVLTLAALFLAFRFPALFPLFLILTVGAGWLTFYLWRYTQVEYEYLIADGEVTFSAVYGKKSRRDLFSFSAKELEKVVSYQADRETCDAFPADKTYFFASSYEDEDTLCALLNPEGGGKVRLFFQGTPAAVTALRRANPAALKGINKSSKPAKKADKAPVKKAEEAPVEEKAPKETEPPAEEKAPKETEPPAEADGAAPEKPETEEGDKADG
ncbi:MAG: hypothetical protein J6Z79_04430 [Clostridia bacterium]|nr:hypothetical protein [Clostridia bacterium]